MKSRLSKSLRNTTASGLMIEDTGLYLAASGIYEIPGPLWGIYADSEDVIQHVTGGEVVVSDGYQDLTPELASAYLCHPISSSVAFRDPSASPNKYQAKWVEDALHESVIKVGRLTHESTGFTYGANSFPYLQSTVTFSNSTRQFSIAPRDTYYIVLIDSNEYVYTTTQTKTITDNEGIWYFYYDSAGALQASQSVWSWESNAQIAALYWDSSNKKAIFFNEERHGAVMDWATHRRIHMVQGLQVTPNSLVIGNYTTEGSGSLNSHAQYSVSDGDVFDEDILCQIRNSASPVNPFEQILSPIAYMPVFYLTSTGLWRRKDPDAYAFYPNAPGTAYYNMLSGGTWSLQSCTNDYFFATWLFFTTDFQYPVASILGQREDANLIDAVNNNTLASLQLGNFFAQERYFYKKLVWQTNTTYGNTPKVRLRYVAPTVEVTPASDRYALICSYNGNAGTGKYLEFYPGQSSDTSPFPIPEQSYVRTITLSAVATSTATVSFFKNTNLVTPLFSISLSASKYAKVSTAYPLFADDKIVAQVTSGSINKPAITIFIQTSL